MARIREGQREYNAVYYQQNRDRIRAQQATYGIANRVKLRVARKGLTVEQFNDLLAEQESRCAICRTLVSVPHIDHDHACCAGSDSCGNCIRGLLCASCNHMLGKAHDDSAVLEAGAEYLRRYVRRSS